MSIDKSSPSAEPRPLFSVIVPHFDDREGLLTCLTSLAHQSIGIGRFEIIVADNATPGGIAEIEQTYPFVRFVSEPKKGAGHARNAAMTLASGENFAFIDADCVAETDWLEQGLRALKTADLVGGGVTVTVAGVSPSPVEAFEQIFAFRQQSYIKRKGFSVTANLFATRAAAIATGEFRHGVPEDLDWCRRASALGFHLAFNDKARVSHPARRTWEDLTDKWDRLISERWADKGRAGISGRVVWAGLAMATALSAAPHLVRVALSVEVSGLRAKMAAAGILARIRMWRAWKMMILLGRAA